MHTISDTLPSPCASASGDDGIVPVATTPQIASPTTNTTVPTPLVKRQCCPINTLEAIPDDVWQDLNNDSLMPDEHFWYCWPPNNDPLFKWPDEDLTIAAKAAITGNLPLLAHMHENHFDIHECTPKGNSLMILAAMGGQLTSMRWLHSRGLDLHARNANFTNALMMAAAYGHTDIIQWLVDNGAHVGFLGEHTDNRGNNALMHAARAGQVEAAKLLISLGAEKSSRNCDHVTALMLAARSGNYAMVKLLCKENLDEVNSLDRYENHAVHYAASGGHLDIIKKLYKRGAEINTVCEWLDNAAIVAASAGSLDTLQWLHRYGVDIHHENESGRNALMIAAEAGYVNIIEYLYEHNEDINRCDSSLRSALMHAVMAGHLDCVQWLHAHGASLDGQDYHNNNIAHLAAEGGHLELLKWSEQHGIDLHSSNEFGQNTLYLATIGGDLPVAQWLHSRSVDVRLIDNRGESALDIAVLNGRFDVVRWLYGENGYTCSKWKMLLYANMYCKLDAMQGLCKDIIDVHSVDSDGCNCLTLTMINSALEPKVISIIRWLYAQGLGVSWEHLNAFLSKDFFLDSQELTFFKIIEKTFFYRKKFTELLTYEDPDKLKNEISLSNKKNMLRVFTDDCQSLDEDEVDKRLMSFRRRQQTDTIQNNALMGGTLN